MNLTAWEQLEAAIEGRRGAMHMDDLFAAWDAFRLARAAEPMPSTSALLDSISDTVGECDHGRLTHEEAHAEVRRALEASDPMRDGAAEADRLQALLRTNAERHSFESTVVFRSLAVLLDKTGAPIPTDLDRLIAAVGAEIERLTGELARFTAPVDVEGEVEQRAKNMGVEPYEIRPLVTEKAQLAREVERLRKLCHDLNDLNTGLALDAHHAATKGQADSNAVVTLGAEVERLRAALDAADARLRRYEGGSAAGMLDRT